MAELDSVYELIGPFFDLQQLRSESRREGVNAVVTTSMVRIDRALMELLPRLEIICCLGTGYDRVDMDTAHARDIVVTHSPAANAPAVAEMALALLLSVTRRIRPLDSYTRSGHWRNRQPAPFMPARSLRGLRLGIVGLGAVGREIAVRAAAFGMQIGYCNRSKRQDVPYQFLPSPLALAEWSDCLIPACRADASNRHCINESVLTALGRDGYIVNVARGSLLDEVALITALKNGTIAGAGLDVFEAEPNIPEELLTLPNVVLTPHVAGATTDSYDTMGRLVLANLDAHFAGEQPPNAVPMTRPIPRE